MQRSRKVRTADPTPVVESTKWLTIVGARQNNLKNITVWFPLGRFVAVTGVSGSGKSSLVNDILREALARALNGAENVFPGTHDRIEGVENLDKVIDIDQSPIGRTPRSNPATYIKVFDEIRDLYAKLPDSKVRGYRPGRFSFNVSCGENGGGRCEACEGNGSNKIEMELLADIWVTCPSCNGRRFSKETLQVLFKGKSIADVLEMDVQQALDHFESVPQIARMLTTLHEVGLDYLKLGQSSTTLSGGEAQRIKLARELVKKSTGRTLYILDEPTTGLHFADVKRLLSVLHRFVDAGNTVVVIEHNLDVVKTADWVIDLGPEGGVAGGCVVAEGTPEQIARRDESHTGVALRDVLGMGSQRRDGASRVAVPADGSPSTRRRSRTPESRSITVLGARENNLKGVNAEIPRDRMTVCCGPSGSGKTSFAIDTLYVEGQRRYVEALSSYARQFLGRLQPPKVDHVHGLAPAISIEQRNTSRSPRSTVGTVTEIHDYLRVLWSRVGTPHCPKCRVPVGSQSAEEVVERLLSLGAGRRALLLAPVQPEAGESYADLFRREQANGFTRIRIDGAVVLLADPPAIRPRSRHTSELVIDRIVLDRAHRGRLNESVEQALVVGDGRLSVLLETGDEARRSTTTSESVPSSNPTELRFSRHHACEQCGVVYEKLNPHHFSFNHRLGWCETCEGLGVQHRAGGTVVIADPLRSLLHGAVTGWGEVQPNTALHRLICALARAIGFDPQTPWTDLTEAQQAALLHGSSQWVELGDPCPESGKRAAPDESSGPPIQIRWRGFYPALERALRSNRSLRDRIGSVMTEMPCSACHGSRFRPESAAVRLGGETLHGICAKPLSAALDWFRGLRLDPEQQRIAGGLLHEITSRLGFLVDVGLDYLSLGRKAGTLSGGEAQRIQLASQIGTGLTGVLYVLDEPTIGLHPRDNRRLIQAITRLRDLGNTLVVVEHDREVIAAADHVLDFGPGAGSMGGEITAAGHPGAIRKARSSLTGRYLSGREMIPIPKNRRVVPKVVSRGDLVPIDDEDSVRPTRGRRSRAVRSEGEARWLTLCGARENNLKNVSVGFPLGRFVCVTGVSGSGKSTLVSTILVPALAARLHRATDAPGAHDRLLGIEHVDKVIRVDQTPIGISPASNPATYTGAFDGIRGLFARLPLSRIRGYTPERFSFNRPGGRCEACQGMGQQCIEMHFLPDVWVECEECKGRRYVQETLEVEYHGKSIADVLQLRVSEALTLFDSVPNLRRLLKTLDDVGLGYLQLGQSGPTLSGGEAQRVKLAAELGKSSTGRTVYILDEPTTGLHFDDLRKLIHVLQGLVDQGNTVICIEHNLDVIKSADWVIDLGPEGGDAGGQVVACGTPEDLVRAPESHTGNALRPMLEAGPYVQREPLDADSELERLPSGSKVPTMGDDIRMPWEVDGIKWHSENHVGRDGAPVGWDGKTLRWVVAAIESCGPFEGTDWSNRVRIEIKAPGAVPWFCHILTGGRDLFDVSLRVGQGTFSQAKLQSQLGIPTLDERKDLPIYGQWSRVVVRRHGGGWDEIKLYLRDEKDIGKGVFRAFLKQAANAYFAKVRTIAEDPLRAKPWKALGREWHLSQKSIHRKHKIEWQPGSLLALAGRFKLFMPDLEFDWSEQTSVGFRRPGEPRLGKIVTNLGDSLRVEVRTPRGMLTPTQVDRLGEDVEIRRSGDSAYVIFRLRSLEQNDHRQMAEFCARLGAGRAEEELQSA